MKRYRQITAALLALLLPLTMLAGCGKQETPASEEPAEQTPQKETIVQNTQPFRNPISLDDAADPYVTYDSSTGYYYALVTRANYIEIFRSQHLATLFTEGDSKVVYRVNGQKNGIWGDVWSPEMHRGSNGKWYIYTSGRDGEYSSTLHLFVLSSQTEDPFGGWSFSRILTSGASTIDPTLYTAADGSQYLCYSRSTETDGSVLEITRMTSPTWCSKQSAVIAKNELPWELIQPAEQTSSVMEGPFFLEHGGRLFIIYSVNTCFSDSYSLGVLEYVGGDLCNPASWQKHPEPLLTMGNGVYGPGHASFFYSPDGTEVFVAYHGMKEHNETVTWVPRYANVQRVTFDETGCPVLGQPIGYETDILPPSGERE